MRIWPNENHTAERAGMAGNNHAGLIWDIADILRGDYRQADYGKVILPFTVLRRLDAVLGDTKADALGEAKRRTDAGITNLEPFLTKVTGFGFYNASPLNFQRLLDDPPNIARNVRGYIEGFSQNVRTIFEEWKFAEQVDYLASQNLLYLVVQRFADVDLHPNAVSNHDMGLIFEELIRKFAELSNETAGEHFTPREVVQLAVNLLFAPDDEVLTKPGVIRSVYDPTAGTGGSPTSSRTLSMSRGVSLRT
jgi:type I restriction enzyme M protein